MNNHKTALHYCPNFPILAIILLMGLAGCGYETYEHRLEETKKYYAYVEKMNLNLGPYWKNEMASLRVPKQFEEIPLPPRKQDDEPLNPKADPRQPKYAKLLLPGLQATWQAEVEVVSGQQTFEAPSFIYLCSNWEIWKQPNGIDDAPNFYAELVTAIVTGLGVPMPEQTDWQAERFPFKSGYVQPEHYDAVVLTSANPIALNPEHPGLKTLVDFHIFLHKNSNPDIQTGLIFAYPQGHDPREKLNERMELCLETLQVSDSIPMTRGGTPNAGGNQSGSATDF